MTSLNELADILRPPEKAPASLDWSGVESQLGHALPRDYKEFIGIYGSGSIDDFLWVLHPTTSNPHVNLLAQQGPRLEALREIAEKTTPAERLTPWAITDNGDVVYWRWTSDDADSWQVTTNESRGPEWDDFAGGAVEWLHGVLSSSHVVSLFPSDFPSSDPVFSPSDAE